MRDQHTAMQGRRTRRLVAAALGALLVAGSVLVPATAAQAMTQVGTPPSVQPGGSVVATIQNQQGGTGNWTITAPPQTEIISAESRPGTGLGQFSCAPVNGGAQAACGTSTWGVGNQVLVTLAVDPTATLGTKTGSSGIDPFEAPAPYSITVTAPAAPVAPTITAPPAGTESIDRQPTITGTKTTGEAATTGTVLTATIDGEPLCTVPAGPDADWSCTPTAPLAVGQHTVEATQTDRFGQTSPTATSTFTVLAAAGLRITQSGGERILAGFPAVRTVTLSNPGAGEARGVVLSATRGRLQVPRCELDGTRIDCASLRDGLDLGTLAPGAQRVLRLTVAAPQGTAPGTAFPISATASSTTASVSPVTSDATLTTRAPSAPVITAPSGSTTDRTPAVRGLGAIERATVTVRQGGTVLCTATGGSGGAWSCTPSRTFALGAATIAATQTYGGIESSAASARFTVASAPRPGGTTPVPGSGSGSTGGRPGPTAGTGPSGSAGGSGTTGGPGPSGTSGSSAGNGGAPGSTPSSAPSGSGTSDSGDGAAGSDPNGGGGAGGGGAGGGGAGGGSGAGGTGGGSGSGTGGALPVDMRFGTQRIVPGTAADMRGTLGPNASGAAVVIDFSGRMSPGMVYRDVHVEVEGETLACEVGTTTFACSIPLDPGQQADVTVRVYADAVNAPDTAVQQLAVASDRQAQANAVTVTTAVAKGTTEAAELADQITTFNVTEFPDAMVPLLAMILFALAAAVATRRPTEGGATGASSASSPAPTDPPADPGSTR
ncbi:Ig-like domain-containing protein [Curtobacterium sp. NPDC089689]|uniref:Ig-like domain-containing protein n=1 Tax=Curtobacterium sp. NPDC089689 TaxID=3363968 RepID=UPI00380D3752